MSRETLNLMNEEISRFAKLINEAIQNETPIIIRHHADTDGIVSGLALENAISEKIKSRGARPEFYIYRKSSQTPFYQEADILRDIILIEKFILKKKGVKPLIILADIGSGKENIFSLELARSYDLKVAIVDHHNPYEKISDIAFMHINPHLVGGYHDLTAGMICHSISRKIYSANPENFLLPALSSIGDKSESDIAIEYRNKCNITEERLISISRAIDYLAFHLKNDIPTEILNNLLYNKNFQDIMIKEVNHQIMDALNKAKNYLTRADESILIIDLDKASKFRDFPSAGKITGLVHRDQDADVTFGVLNDFIIIRIKEGFMTLENIASLIKKEFPESIIDFGGHDVAGTIKYENIDKKDLLKFLEKIKKFEK